MEIWIWNNTRSASNRGFTVYFIFSPYWLSFFVLFRSLSSNQLSTLPRGLIDETSRLDTLTLDDNPWVCDCRLNWMILWLQSTTRVSRNTATSKMPICMEPFEFQGQRLTSIRPLQCSSSGTKPLQKTKYIFCHKWAKTKLHRSPFLDKDICF